MFTATNTPCLLATVELTCRPSHSPLFLLFLLLLPNSYYQWYFTAFSPNFMSNVNAVATVCIDNPLVFDALCQCCWMLVLLQLLLLLTTNCHYSPILALTHSIVTASVKPASVTHLVEHSGDNSWCHGNICEMFFDAILTHGKVFFDLWCVTVELMTGFFWKA